jgi:hypothetical protein
MRLPVYEPITKGVLLALFSVVVASIGAAFFLSAVPPASPDLLQNLALIGADLLAVSVALLGAQHRLAGHTNSLDDLGLGFVVVSLVVLAGTLVAQPLLAQRFAEGNSD